MSKINILVHNMYWYRTALGDVSGNAITSSTEPSMLGALFTRRTVKITNAHLRWQIPQSVRHFAEGASDLLRWPISRKRLDRCTFPARIRSPTGLLKLVSSTATYESVVIVTAMDVLYNIDTHNIRCQRKLLLFIPRLGVRNDYMRNIMNIWYY